MTEMSIYQHILFLLVTLLFVIPLGNYIASVFEFRSTLLDKICGPVEQRIYRFCNIQANQEMNWKTYLIAMLVFNCIGMLFIYFIQRLQLSLPLNPQRFAGVTPELAFNTAASFTTNTDWQAYSGETTMSYCTQMLALSVQNFLSAATGLALLIAFIRGIANHESEQLGNFWVDIIRGTLYIFLPLALIFAVFLTSQGVVQNFKAYQNINVLEPHSYQQIIKDAQNNITTETINISEQTIAMGPAASQVAIKQLGSNGGGFFNTNSAHPFENPTPLTNFFELFAILLIPAASCYAFGVMVNDKRQGWALLITMFALFTPILYTVTVTEQVGNPIFTSMGITQTPITDSFPGGNMEGKETRFGIASSTMWAAATTATANGSVNSMHDSYLPLSEFGLLWMMHVGEVIFGGMGSGLYGILLLVIITVFISGLMVGRTPEYLGKKIEPYEMKMASFAVLVMPLVTLLFTAIACVTTAGTSSIANPGAHGFSEMLYAFTSMTNNNGSALAGLNTNTPFYNLLGGLAILVGRYWIAIPTLAIAGALIRKKAVPTSPGTLATHTPLFIILLIFITVILGALSFVPALALGPIVEHLLLWSTHVSH